MLRYLMIVLALTCWLPSARSQDAADRSQAIGVDVGPGKFLRINFPDLPPTLLALTTGNDILGLVIYYTMALLLMS